MRLAEAGDTIAFDIPPTDSGYKISGGQVSGTACPGCTVEIFSDFEDEGRTFEGATVADAAGNWSLDVSPAGPNVTATATDGAGNTSEFSAPAAVPGRWVYLPLVWR